MARDSLKVDAAPGGAASGRRTRGIVLTPAELAFEGTETVLHNVEAAGANAVAITPGVYLPASADTGLREPPLDVAGHVRQLDRPLWGGNVSYVQRFAPFEPDPAIWESVPFHAPIPAPREHRVDVTRQAIDWGRQHGIDTWIILSPSVLPGLPGGHSMSSGSGHLDVDERPLPIAGERSGEAIAGQGCPNSDHVRNLVVANVREALRHYGDATGIQLDWLEYTCYFPEDVFTCVCPSCRASAMDAGLDWDAMAGGVQSLWDRFHNLNDDDLRLIAKKASLTAVLDADQRDAVRMLWEFKANSVTRLLATIDATVRASGFDLPLGANGFAPPFGTWTGADFATMATQAAFVRPKFFTFHWSMMVRWYGETILSWNPGLDSSLVTKALLSVFDIHPSTTRYGLDLSDYGMPEPGEPHPVSADDVRRKLADVAGEVGTTAKVEAYVHSYQPASEFDALMHAVGESSITGEWVQRYGYLSDEKLEILAKHWT